MTEADRTMTDPVESMAVSVRRLPADASMSMHVVFWVLQPALLLSVLAAWLMDPQNPALFGLTLLGVHLLLGALEYRMPARRHGTIRRQRRPSSSVSRSSPSWSAALQVVSTRPI